MEGEVCSAVDCRKPAIVPGGLCPEHAKGQAAHQLSVFVDLWAKGSGWRHDISLPSLYNVLHVLSFCGLRPEHFESQQQ